MSDKVKNVFSPKAYAELLAMGYGTKKAGELQAERVKEREGAYTHAVRAAIICRDESKGDQALAVLILSHTFDKLDQNIQYNIDSCAALFGAKERTKVGKNGEKYTLPSAVSSAKSQLAFAVGHGVALTVSKDGKETPVSFTAIRKVNDSIRERASVEKALTLTGKPAQVFRASRALTVALDKVGDMEEPALIALTLAIMQACKLDEAALLPKVPDVTGPAATLPTIQKTVHTESTEAASAPAKPAKKGKKGPKGAGDMIEEGQKKAA